MTPEARAQFIRANTALAAPPLVPEIRLRLASDVTPLWQATEASLERAGLPPPYWAFAWPGGQALARYILDHPDVARGRRVLDFGAGSGLVAIAAMKAGAAAAIAADIDPFAAEAIRLNAAENAVSVSIQCEDFANEKRTECQGNAGEMSRLILCGDMCYEKPLADRLLAWLRLRQAAGAAVLLGDPGRAYLPPNGLTFLAKYTVPTSLDLEDRTLRETSVYRLA